MAATFKSVWQNFSLAAKELLLAASAAGRRIRVGKLPENKALTKRVLL
jgi:hypothetical protein